MTMSAWRKSVLLQERWHVGLGPRKGWRSQALRDWQAQRIGHRRCERGRTGKTVAWIFCQTAHNNCRQCCWNSGINKCWRGRYGGEMLRDDIDRRISTEWGHTGDYLIENNAQ